MGDIIHEMYLKPSNLSLKEAAQLCNLTEQQLDSIISGKLEIGYELAYKLATGFNTSHSFWLSIQQDAKKQ